MKRRILGCSVASLSVLLAAFAGCSAPDAPARSAETTARATAAVTSTGLLPYPVKTVNGVPQKDAAGNAVPVWDGSIIDLYAADALAECAANSPFAIGLLKDKYLASLEASMAKATCTPASNDGGAGNADAGGSAIAGFTITDPTSVTGGWAVTRLTAQCNVDPTTSAPKALSFTNCTRHGLPTSAEPNEAKRREVEPEINYAEINLCMAQRLREVSSTGDALFLSAVDQQQLLEVTRERAQIAMLQYAALGNAFAAPAGTAQSPANNYQALSTLRTWANSSAAVNQQAMKELGQDFANAVQLHVIASKELAELLGRSASAHAPRGGTATAAPDVEWGPGSWRQRLMASLYGGDPIVQVSPQQPAAPWKYFDEANVTWPGDGKPGLFGDGAGTITWPNDPAGPAADRDPLYVRTEQAAPEAQIFLSLARTFDALDFRIVAGPGGRADVDEATTWPFQYKLVEAGLEAAACRAATPTQSCLASDKLSAIAGDDVTTKYPGYLLWQRYRVRPIHAQGLVAQIAEAIPKAILTGGAPDPTQLAWPGAMRVVAANDAIVSATVLGGGATGTWYHVDKSAAFAPLDNVDRAPLYTRFTSYRLPSTLDPSVQAQGLGLVEHMASDEPVRILGAIPALAVVRDALRLSLAHPPVSPAAAAQYFTRTNQMLALVDAAIGPTTLSVVPSTKSSFGAVVESTSLHRALDGCWPYGSSCWVSTQNGSPGTSAEWEVGVLLGKESPFSGANMKLVVVPGGSLTSTLASVPAAKQATTPPKTFFGKKLSDVVATAVTPPAAPVAVTSVTPANGHALVHQRFVVTLPAGATPKKFSFLLQSPTGDYLPLGEDVELRTLAATLNNTTVTPATSAPVNYPVEGQYLAYDGDLGAMARRAWTTATPYSAEAAYDGFGLPLHWVPPSDPRLFGSTAGDDATSYYLKTAQDAANQATDAVKSAIDELLKEQADDATLASAQRRAAGIDAIEQRALCGDQNPQCDTTMVQVPPQVPFFVAHCHVIDGSDGNAAYSVINDLTGADPSVIQGYFADYLTLCQSFESMTDQIIGSGAVPFAIGEPVAQTLSLSVAPDFAAYQGGTLQGVFIDQWQAFHHVQNYANEFSATALAAWTRIDEAYRFNVFKKYKTLMACTRDLYVGALSGLSFGTSGFGWSPGPLLAAMSACQDAQTQENIEGDSSYGAALAQSFAQLASMTTTYSDSLSALQAASAKGDLAIHESALDNARADLEASLSADTLVTKLSTYRRYHSYDMWRAEALLESARRYGVTARRTIESKLVVDLSTMHADEPFVAAPAAWADEIYEYDLDAPSSVGLSAMPTGSGGIYPNRISDYVGNLQDFLNGFTIARPTSVAKSDAEVLSIGGPDEHVATPTAGVTTLSEDARRWQLQCPDGTWQGRVPFTTSGTTPPPETPFAQMCGGAKPTRARFSFTLDPWGRIDGDMSNAPFDARYNARWQRLAINLVGTAVLDCSAAASPPDCYTQPYVAYDLVHTGPAWTTGYDETWRQLDIGSARVEAGKGLAAEEWLDPVSNGWGKPMVEAVARTELADRPFGGSYAIEIPLAPEVHPERVERVQVLLESSYWVKQ